ncbi:exonuclease [Klebsiella phage Kpn BU9]|nr:exonuclease [Klebsiella phage Kpn BU9]
MTRNATFSASGSKRWLSCPGSVQLSQRIDFDEPLSTSKQEGKAAHWVLEQKIKGKPPLMPCVAPNGITVTDDMHEHADEFIADVLSVGAKIDPLFSEVRIHIDWLLPGQYGICDYRWYDFLTDTLYVWDYKYGHQAVEAEDNTQGVYYALDQRCISSVKQVVFTVVQPRAWHPNGTIRRWQFSRSVLMNWADRFKKGFTDAHKIDAPLVVGDHCHYCPARGLCPALYERIIELATVLDAPPSLTPEEVGQRLQLLEELYSRASDAKTALHIQGLHFVRQGKPLPGFKLAPKQTRRQLTDEGKLIGAAPMFGVMPDTLYERKLKPLATLEKTLPKALVDMCTTKPDGQFALVPDTDARTGFSTMAESVFNTPVTMPAGARPL